MEGSYLYNLGKCSKIWFCKRFEGKSTITDLTTAEEKYISHSKCLLKIMKFLQGLKHSYMYHI